MRLNTLKYIYVEIINPSLPSILCHLPSFGITLNQNTINWMDNWIWMSIAYMLNLFKNFIYFFRNCYLQADWIDHRPRGPDLVWSPEVGLSDFWISDLKPVRGTLVATTRTFELILPSRGWAAGHQLHLRGGRRNLSSRGAVTSELVSTFICQICVSELYLIECRRYNNIRELQYDRDCRNESVSGWWSRLERIMWWMLWNYGWQVETKCPFYDAFEKLDFIKCCIMRSHSINQNK